MPQQRSQLRIGADGALNIDGSTYASVSAFNSTLLAALILQATGAFEISPQSDIANVSFNPATGLLSWTSYGQEQNVTLTDPVLNQGWELAITNVVPPGPEDTSMQLLVSLARLAVGTAGDTNRGVHVVSQQVLELAKHVKQIEEHLPVAAVGAAALGAKAAKGGA